ncbi:creatininase family protein [Candidatus Aerophobetes bacterium]|nr:creatininase family protein [Candidatus Aerophobetes bacterium]
MWITTENPAIIFEDSAVGKMKKEVWDASEEEIGAILKEYEIPSPPELGKAGSYIQTTPRHKLVENRRKNDVVLITIGSTECHGRHAPSGHDSFQVSQVLEGVRRYTAKKGKPVNLAFNPINYGAHPYHHIGIPGTVIIPPDVVKETLIYVMLGLWNDGFRKQIIVNNHGHFWVMETALHEFMYRYQLPGVFQVLDWPKAIREFLVPGVREDSLETPFVHADETETSWGLLLFPEMIDMEVAEKAQPKRFLPGDHWMDAAESFHRPHRWSEGEGHAAIELSGTPEGVVGDPTRASARKAKRPVVALLKYLTLCADEILEAFPPGKVPPVEEVTLRTAKEMEPYLKEPQSKGWKSVYSLPRIGM